MKVIIAILALNFLFANSQCPSGWEQGLNSNKCIKIFAQSLNWFKAEQYCEQYNGYLTSIASAFENSYIYSYVSENLKNSTEWWIGANTVLVPGVWSWSDGSQFGYKNLGTGQNCNDSDCCLTQHNQNAQWDIHPCLEVTKPFVCEWLTNTPFSTPKPGSTIIPGSTQQQTIPVNPTTQKHNTLPPPSICKAYIATTMDNTNDISKANFSKLVGYLNDTKHGLLSVFDQSITLSYYQETGEGFGGYAYSDFLNYIKTILPTAYEDTAPVWKLLLGELIADASNVYPGQLPLNNILFLGSSWSDIDADSIKNLTTPKSSRSVIGIPIGDNTEISSTLKDAGLKLVKWNNDPSQLTAAIRAQMVC